MNPRVKINCMVTASSKNKEPVKAGVAKEVITPPSGVELWGYARQGDFTAEGTYDDLYVRVLILDSPRNVSPIALIVLDLGGLDGNWTREIKEFIEKETSILSTHIIFSVTHTHAGPAPFATRGVGNPNYQYLGILKTAIINTVKQALQNMTLVQGGAGYGKVDLSLNRRQRLFDGPIDQDPGNVDPEVKVYRLDTPDHHPVAILVNYTAHPCTLRADNRKFSRDYPGVMIDTVEKNFTHHPQVFFLQGAAGNIEPRVRGNYEITKNIGTLLAKEILRIAEGIKTEPISEILINTKSFSVTWREFSSFEKAIYPRWRRIQNYGRKELLRKLLAGKKPLPLLVPLHVLAIDGTCWISLPGEPFVELGQMLQIRFHKQKFFILGYTDDTRMGYIPSKQAYSQKGYEESQAFRYYGLDMPVAPETGEKIVKEFIKMVKQIKRTSQNKSNFNYKHKNYLKGG